MRRVRYTGPDPIHSAGRRWETGDTGELDAAAADLILARDDFEAVRKPRGKPAEGD